MRAPLLLTLGLLGLVGTLHAAEATDTKAMTDADPHQWLEDVGGDKALAWVRERNAESASITEDLVV